MYIKHFYMLSGDREMKKTVCIILLMCLLLSGCDGGLLGKTEQEPPRIKITAGDDEISYVINKNRWNAEVYDRLGDVESAAGYTGSFDPCALITVDFGEDTPQSVKALITDVKILSAGCEETIVSDKEYTPFNGLVSLKDDTAMAGGDIRVFSVRCIWEDGNDVSYVFACKNPISVLPAGEFRVECDYEFLSAEYNGELSVLGGVKFFDEYVSYDEFVKKYGINIGEGYTAEDFENSNVVLVFDYDSPSPLYRKPEVNIKMHRLTVTKYDETSKITDTNIITRGYAVVLAKDICRMFDIDDDTDIYYIWAGHTEE